MPCNSDLPLPPCPIGHGGDEEATTTEGANPYANMSARQRKMYELRQKLQQCRKANQTAVVAEKKRQSGKVGEGSWPGRGVAAFLTIFIFRFYYGGLVSVLSSPG